MEVSIKIIIFFSALLFSSFAFSADGETTEYFGALWDFIDWIFEVFEDIKQTTFDFLNSISKTMIYWYIQIQINVATSIWEIIEPMIDALNLTDVVSNNFGFLSQDVKMIITEFRIGEAVNLLLSAYGTRTIFRMMNS